MKIKSSPSLSFNTVKLINSMIAIAIAALAVLLVSGCSSAPAAATQAAPPPSLPVAEVHTSSITTYQEYPASVEGTVNVEVRPQVSGTLDRVFA